MKRSWLGVALGLPVCALFVAVGCGDDEVFRDSDVPDATADAAADGDDPRQTRDGAAPDAGPGCADTTGVPARALLSINNFPTSELVAFDLAAKKVDGRFVYDGFTGTTSAGGAEPFVAQQAGDGVARLDAREPWKPVTRWSLALDDAGTSSEPVSVAGPPCGKQYVARLKRNAIAVLDGTQKGDAGGPVKTIDLSSFVDAEDKDGLVDPVAAVFVPARNRVFVLLANLDFTRIKQDVNKEFTSFCAPSKPTLIAIDPTTDTVVSLGGTGKNGGIALDGYNPSVSTSMVYDAVGDRFLVLSGGCKPETAPSTAGPLQRRRVESVSLATGQVTTLLSLDDRPELFPLSITYADTTRAAIGFYGEAYFWNPQETKLGAKVKGSLDYFAHDGKGNLVGTRATYFADGGAGPLEVWRVPFGDGGAAGEKLGENPFTDNSGFVSGVEIWPRP